MEVCRLADARFEEIPSFELFARVAALYWAEEAYPNHLFPEIAAVLPVILVSSTGRMRIPAPKTLLPRNIRLDYALAEEFLGSDDFASRTLPSHLLDQLTRASRSRSGWFARDPAWCRRFEPTLGPADAGRLIAAERRAVAGLSECDLLGRFFEMIHCTIGPVDLSWGAAEDRAAWLAVRHEPSRSLAGATDGDADADDARSAFLGDSQARRAGNGAADRRRLAWLSPGEAGPLLRSWRLVPRRGRF